MDGSAAEIARRLHLAFHENTFFPDGLGGSFTLDQAYDIQFHLLSLRETQGERLAGWKVGLTAKAMQEQQGVHEPCFGHLLASGLRSSPAQFAFDRLIAPGFENELCLRIASRLEGRQVAFDEAVSAIDAVAPALEIVEKRNDFRANLPLAIAGNAQQHAYVLGDFVPFEGGLDLAHIEAAIEVEGRIAERAFGAEVLGSPVNSIIWLAAKLADYGRALEPGALVMSGSFTRQYALDKGARIRTIFSQIGETAASFG